MLKSTLNATSYIIEQELENYPEQKDDLEFLNSFLKYISRQLPTEESAD